MPPSAVPPATTASSIVDLMEPVRAELQAVEHMMATRDVTAHPDLRQAYRDILARGGKRLRPSLALLCASLLRAPDAPLPPSVIALGAAVEMLHTSTLVHDDVIDEATLRRGAPTLNSTWAPDATVLAGNYMFAQAAHYSALTGSARVNRIFSEALELLVDGEILQLKARHDFETTRARYFSLIARKTSSIFRIATECAGILQGYSDARVRGLKRFGLHLGIAFQVVDDILDYTSDRNVLGKPAGSDLLNGNCTLPFFLYLERLPQPDRTLHELREANSWRLRKPEIWEAWVRSFVADVVRSSAVAQAYAVARGHIHQAQDCLALFPASVSRDALWRLGDFVMQRRT